MREKKGAFYTVEREFLGLVSREEAVLRAAEEFARKLQEDREDKNEDGTDREQ